MNIILYGIVGIYFFLFISLFIRASLHGFIKKGSGVREMFYGMGEYIFSKKAMTGLYTHSVREMLKTINPASDINALIKKYYAQKTGDILLVLAGCLFLTMAYACSTREDNVIRNGNILKRSGYEGGTEVSLIARYTDDDTSREIDYELLPRSYPYEELSDMAGELMEMLEEMIIAGNSDLGNITQDVYLLKKAEGYPFDIEWESSRYILVDDSGKVSNEKLSEPEPVTLTAHIKCDDHEWQKSFALMVLPKPVSQDEKWLMEAKEELRNIDEDQQTTEVMTLPDSLLGKEVTWRIKDSGIKLWLPILSIGLGCVLFLLRDHDLKTSMEKRRGRIEASYPEFINKFVLLFGAGLSVRSIFIRISESDDLDDDLGVELKVLIRDLRNGIAEKQAIARFGQRLQSPLYIKFASMLIGNMKKGNSELLKLLRQEAQEALLIRRNIAKKKGEEAGTKLLLPMIMMLGVVMAVIIMPAFMTF